jgi:ABC-type bacteriocin/lantibiotic exporter with double-glycine peptidase domain
MSESSKDLGAVVSIHGTSGVFLQRAAIVAILSFFFFMSMLVVFYVQQQIVYFILSTAFLVVYIFTLIGWVMQRRNTVSIYENGIGHRSFVAAWAEIQSVKADAKVGINIVKTNGQSVTIPKTIAGVDQIAMVIRNHLT